MKTIRAGLIGAGLLAAGSLILTVPVHAQDGEAADPYADTVFSGDYLSIGLGAVISPSYAGSDDYVVSPLPIVQGAWNGIELNPRGSGVGLDFIPDGEDVVGLDFGIAAGLRSDRAMQISDPVVKSLGKLDRAIEVGPTAGLSFSALLNPYDSLTVSTDVRWDIAGAHGGMVVDPSLAYFTPLSEGIAASLTLNAEYGDGDFQDYYFRVSAADNVATAGELPVFDPDGGGFTSAGATLLLGFDLDGQLANGGWGIVAIGGYSRMLGDAKRSPFTSVRGSADQFIGALGVGYTF